jgi:predicted CopG family antitoxin
MTKHLAIKDTVYEELNSLKPDVDRSFSFVIKKLIDENKFQKEEISRLETVVDKLTKGDKTIKQELVTDDYIKKSKELNTESIV